ncbi:MAG: dTMP kinase [Planctomycetota bacterium]
MKAPFISLDGIDGVGKSTQCRLLAEALVRGGWDVVQCVDPGGTQVGQELREILLGSKDNIAMPCEALLFMASRAQLVAEVIRPALAAGKAVVSDRYLLANVVYQGHAGGLDVDALWRIGEFATGGLEPDMTFILDLPLEIASKRRKGRDRLETRGDDYFARVRQGFLHEAARLPQRVRVIDATGRVEEIHGEMMRSIAPFLK